MLSSWSLSRMKPMWFLGSIMILVGAIPAKAQTVPVTVIELRKNYPGAKDDSLLTVQNLKPITRKGEDIEAEDFSSVEPTDDSAAPPAQGFGE